MPAATWSRARRQRPRKPIVTGSHCDTVLSGGRYDGIIGVLAGIEVAHTLHEHGVALSIPSRSSTSCPRSRATRHFLRRQPRVSGKLDAAMLPAIPKAKPWRRPSHAVGGDPR